MSLFLTPGELEELVGSPQNSAQKRWLTEHHWAFAIRRDGRVKVAREEFRRQMVSDDPEPKIDQRSTEGNLGRLRRLM